MAGLGPTTHAFAYGGNGVDGRQKLAACGERLDAKTGVRSAPFRAAMTARLVHFCKDLAGGREEAEAVARGRIAAVSPDDQGSM
jgi:hypothetical protein